MNIISFIDRNFNLIFHRDRVVKLTFSTGIYRYNDILIDSMGQMYRALGKNYYKITNLYRI